MAKAVKLCSLGKHPPYPCECGGYRDKQCCDIAAFGIPAGTEGYYGPCPVHKCGKRKGCLCPLPVVTNTAEAKPDDSTVGNPYVKKYPLR